MPDDLLPEADTATSTAETTESVDDVYDAEFDAAMAEDGGEEADADQGSSTKDATDEVEDAVEEKPAAEGAKDKKEEAPKTSAVLTHSEQQALKRAKVPESAWEHLSRDAVEQIVDQQRTIDRFQAEEGRRKAGDKPEDQPEGAKDQQAKQPETREFSPRIKGVFDKLAEVYDDDIREVGSLIDELDQRASRFESTANTVGPMSEILMHSVVDRFIDRLEKDNPSASKPEVRKQIRERFLKEWKSGDYTMNDGESLYDLMGRVVGEAGKVSLAGISTEAAAAASLIGKNRERVKSQPKTGGSRAPQKPKTEDDVYDEAASEFLMQG